MESYAPQNEKSGCRLTFFVLRSIRSSNPLSLRDIPLSGGMPEPAPLRSAEPGCLPGSASLRPPARA